MTQKKEKRAGPARRPGPRGISADDVRQAALALQQQGRFVGPVNIRLELGRGSYATITRYLRELNLSAPPRGKQDKHR